MICTKKKKKWGSAKNGIVSSNIIVKVRFYARSVSFDFVIRDILIVKKKESFITILSSFFLY